MLFVCQFMEILKLVDNDLFLTHTHTLQVEELLSKEDFEEKHHSRTTLERLQEANVVDESTPQARAQKAFPGTIPESQIRQDINDSKKNSRKDARTDDENLAILYSNNQRSFEGMITWTKRLQAVPFRQWTVGASTALDHWIAKRVLGLSEETWLALLEGDSPELMGRGRE